LHTLQWLSVKVHDKLSEAFTKEDALNDAADRVEAYLNDVSNDWYDWFVVGGGRWNEDHQYDKATNMIISYADEPERFKEMISKIIVNRVETHQALITEIDFENLHNTLYAYSGMTAYETMSELYPLRQAINNISGWWDCDSRYFDVEFGSVNPKHMLDRLDNSWYLVPVDFHF
jgi:hypothetical protein